MLVTFLAPERHDDEGGRRRWQRRRARRSGSGSGNGDGSGGS